MNLIKNKQKGQSKLILTEKKKASVAQDSPQLLKARLRQRFLCVLRTASGCKPSGVVAFFAPLALFFTTVIYSIPFVLTHGRSGL